MKIKQHEAKPLDTGQNDNIIRDGVLTTQQAYDMFKRAGMTTKEWLQKTYGTTNDPNEEEMRDIENAVTEYQDKTDIEDYINIASEKLNEIGKERTKLIEENNALREKIMELSEKNNEKTLTKEE